MAAYDPLISHLKNQSQSSVTLAFATIEALLNRPLPDSATKYPAFWSKGNHLGRQLLAAGWKASPRLRSRHIVFNRIGTTAARSRMPHGARTSSPPRGTPVATHKQEKPPDIVLVGCVKSKREGRQRAEDLYTSSLFVGRAEHARATGKPWFILSAKHGLLKPSDLIGTYDVALKELPARERHAWSARVLEQIDERIGPVRGNIIEIHAGKAYCDFGLVNGLEQRGAHVTVPLAHLRQGEQLRWYAERRQGQDEASVNSPKSVALRPSKPPIGSDRICEVVTQLTTEFSDGQFDLSSRPNAPPCGWEGIPEIEMARQLRESGVSDVELRIILTLGVAMDRARDADRLWKCVVDLWHTEPWAFDPGVLNASDKTTLRKALARTGVSQRHGKDSHAWQRIGAALADPESPPAFRDVVYRGVGAYGDLLAALGARCRDGEPWFPLLRGPKISLVWLRMLAVPGGADIEGLERMPVAVDVQVRKATEYLGATDTLGMPIRHAKPTIQRVWHDAAERAVGPCALAGTSSALDPAIWFFGKWGCTRCEKLGARVPISSLCGACRFDSFRGVRSEHAESVRRERC